MKVNTFIGIIVLTTLVITGLLLDTVNRLVTFESNKPVSVVRKDYSSLRDSGVTVLSKLGTGSATLFKTEEFGFVHYWAITAAHVVESENEVFSLEVPEFELGLLGDSSIVVGKDLYNGSMTDGATAVPAKVIAISHYYDIAILKLSQRIHGAKFINFDKSNLPRAVGTSIIHVGSPFGPVLGNSMTFGKISGTDRRMVKFGLSMDQVDAIVEAGSSGGAIFDESGTYIGMVVMERGQIGFFLPMREIIKWAESKHLDWLFKNQED